MDASLTPQDLSKLHSADPAPLIIDVRREPVFQVAPGMIANPERRDPAIVADWAGSLPRGRHIFVYCLHGHEVSQNAARALREHCYTAQFLEGGIEAWRAAGGTLQLNPSRS